MKNKPKFMSATNCLAVTTNGKINYCKGQALVKAFVAFIELMVMLTCPFIFVGKLINWKTVFTKRIEIHVFLIIDNSKLGWAKNIYI